MMSHGSWKKNIQSINLCAIFKGFIKFVKMTENIKK